MAKIDRLLEQAREAKGNDPLETMTLIVKDGKRMTLKELIEDRKRIREEREATK